MFCQGSTRLTFNFRALWAREQNQGPFWTAHNATRVLLTEGPYGHQCSTALSPGFRRTSLVWNIRFQLGTLPTGCYESMLPFNRPTSGVPELKTHTLVIPFLFGRLVFFDGAPFGVVNTGEPKRIQ